VIETKIGSRQNIDKLTVLRGLFAIAIFIRHLWIPEIPFFSIFSLNLNFLLKPHGNIFVRLFFLLSGYLIAKRYYENKYSLDLKGAISFYKHRINRIFPLYFFLVILFTILIYRDFLFSQRGWYVLFRVITFTYSTDLVPRFTGAFWSLSTEIQFYVICPFVFFLLSKLKKIGNKLNYLLALGFVNFISGVLIARLGSIIPEYPKSFLYYFIVFIFGIFLQLLFIRLPKIQISYKTSNMLFAFLCVILYFYTSYTHYFFVTNALESSYSRWIYPTLTCLIGGSLIYLAELHPAQIKVINWKMALKKPGHLFEIMGILSYGFYLWHGEVIFLIMNVNQNISIFQTALLSFAAFVVSVLLSILSYFLIEKRVRFVKLK
jgi:peptidoglycan/LPS O-acetylase OafA/YrhL